jgi:hypothetical protein
LLALPLGRSFSLALGLSLRPLLRLRARFLWTWRAGPLLLPGAEFILLVLLALWPILDRRSLPYKRMRIWLIARLWSRWLVRASIGPIGLLGSSATLRLCAIGPRHCTRFVAAIGRRRLRTRVFLAPCTLIRRARWIVRSTRVFVIAWPWRFVRTRVVVIGACASVIWTRHIGSIIGLTGPGIVVSVGPNWLIRSVVGTSLIAAIALLLRTRGLIVGTALCSLTLS